MNLLDCEVTEILCEPYFKYNKWNIKVKDTCYGREGETTLQFDTEEESKNVKIGYEFLS